MSNPSTPAPAPARSSGLSLYANLLDPSSTPGATTGALISKGPVVFKPGTTEEVAPEEVAAAKKQQIDAAILKFQPIQRQKLSSQKPKPKSTFPKAPPPPAAPAQNDSGNNAAAAASAAKPAIKSSIADWTADDDDVNGFYGFGEKRQRGGRKRRKKNKEEYTVVQDWDDIYDPSRPNNYEEYKNSDEKIRDVREWKDRLYAHRMARKYSTDSSDDEASSRPRLNAFAPPAAYSAVPPPPPPEDSAPPRPPVPAAEVPDDKTGEDAYARRLRMSQAGGAVPPPPPPPSDPEPPPPPEIAQPGVISRAPVRYNLPPPPTDIPASEAELEEALADEAEAEEADADSDAPRSNRPGQKGFAERLMSKYGWSKGQGLGASGDGIINPLRVQVEKRRKKPDAEGGGFADPKGMGKIIGGKKGETKTKDAGDEGGKFGVMSEVVILRGMVDGLDLDDEMEGGGLMQEIGDECAEKYGRVERVFIDRNGGAQAKVFVKFTSQLSALRAVNALEGRIFNGNAISARFFDAERFEQGLYE